MLNRTFNERLARFVKRDGRPIVTVALTRTLYPDFSARHDWDAAAPYMTRNRELFDQDYNGRRTKELKRAVDLVEDSRNMVVVDAGCGDGYNLAVLGKFFPDRSFVGYDASREMVRLAQDRVHRHGLGNVRIVQASHEEALGRLGTVNADLILSIGTILIRAGHVQIDASNFDDPGWEPFFHDDPGAVQLASHLVGVRSLLKEGGRAWVIRPICCLWSLHTEAEVARRSGLTIDWEATHLIGKEAEDGSGRGGVQLLLHGYLAQPQSAPRGPSYEAEVSAHMFLVLLAPRDNSSVSGGRRLTRGLLFMQKKKKPQRELRFFHGGTDGTRTRNFCRDRAVL